jgi:predicted nucleotidyltransferase
MRNPVPAARVLALLPIAVRSRLEELLAALHEATGPTLEAVVAYGSAVRGGYVPDRSDVNLAIVLQDDAPEILDARSAPLRVARAAARVSAILLRMDELARAADVFPLLYDDIRGCHSLLTGRDVFSDLVIHDEHRRLRIEQELREASLQLRQIVTSDGVSSELLAVPLARMTKKVRGPLHALLLLQGRRIDDSLADVLRVAAESWGADSAALLSPDRAPHETLRALRRVLDGAIHEADVLRAS